MTDAPTVADPTPADALRALEPPTRLSRSLLWSHLRDYYEDKGVDAWGVGATPHAISTNPVLARAYAQVLVGWLEDLVAGGLDEHAEVFVVELGAGSGRFAFHLLRALDAALPRAGLTGLRLTVVMTDLSEANLRWWAGHPRLRPYLESGRLDLASFDVAAPSELQLRHSGRQLGPDEADAIALINNYLFDSTPQDSFALRGGELYENLVQASVRGGGEEVGLGDLVLSGQSRPLQAEDYADEPGVVALLAEYRDTLGAGEDTHLTLPTSGLRCVHWFAERSGGELLLLLGDKGPVELDALRDRPLPPIVEHGGSISLPVNFHAVGRWLTHRGGRMLATPERRVHFEIVAGVLGRSPGSRPRLEQAYTHAVIEHNPTDFFELRQWAIADAGERPVSHALSLLRQCGHDDSVFEALAERFAEESPKAPAGLRAEIARALHRVSGGWFPTPQGMDVAFEVGGLLVNLDRYDLARQAFMESMRFAGPDPATFVNLGVCCLELGELPAAMQCAEEALKRDPTMSQARSLLAEVQRRQAQPG